MKIDVAAHKAAQAAENERFANLESGWERIKIGQHLRVVNGDLELYFDWLEWLNFHADRLIRPMSSRMGLSDTVWNANPEYWTKAFRHGRYLPAWAVSWIMRFKYGRDSLL